MKDEKKENLVRLTREQSRAIDVIAGEKYRVPGIVLMENAARAAADLADEMVGGKISRVNILCGPGNNGGDGLAIARHLHNRGHGVRIYLLGDPVRYKGDALINWKIVEAMGISCSVLTPQSNLDADLIIDALFGTGLTEEPRAPFGEIAGIVNAGGIPVLAVDIPSGLDCDTGKPLGSVAIRANQTITFVAEKIGFSNPAAREFLGRITVGDIGCPRECVEDVLNTVRQLNRRAGMRSRCGGNG